MVTLNTAEILRNLDMSETELEGGTLLVRSPIDGATIGQIREDSAADVDVKIMRADRAFQQWRLVPAPKRGELVRLLGEELRAHKQSLGALVSLEMGKIYQEGLGEVQEMIDICDFAVGLSRQLYGLTIASERPGHKMFESWHPLGVVGIISAFNFPVAVWSWNAVLALVCGNSILWKPSEKTPITALATQKLFERTMARFGDAPEGLSDVIIGDQSIGGVLVDDPRVPLISATGSTAMGRAVAPRVAARFGRSILELGGNNAIIVAPSADLDMALRAILFGAVGTCGQRCTTTRRLFVHDAVYAQLVPKLKSAYGRIRIGNPLDPETLVGPLIDRAAYEAMSSALDRARGEGGVILGGNRVGDLDADSYYVEPALVELPGADANVYEETFAPLLYVMKYSEFSEVLARHNAVPQGLSSAIFTNDVRESEAFTAAAGSDCGIANVNIGTSGAEIGGAFGGEKETGGGRESGSDSWRGYMRRQTSTVNYSKELPLAQGIKFDAS